MARQLCKKCGSPLEDRNPVCSRCGPPPGVTAWTVDEEGHVVYFVDPLSVHVNWPDVRISSFGFKKWPIEEQLFARAKANVRAAAAVCREAGEEPTRLDWPLASVCYYLLQLGTELFLKAAIRRAGVKAPHTHSVSILLARYRELLPGEQFAFPIYWIYRPREAAELTGDTIDGIDATPDELFRYGVDKADRGSEGFHFFHPGRVYNGLQDLLSRWERIWPIIDAQQSR